MSRLIKCAEGHFYDADKWKQCPICNDEFNNKEKESPDEMGGMKTMHIGNLNGDMRKGLKIFDKIMGQAKDPEETIPVTAIPKDPEETMPLSGLGQPKPQIDVSMISNLFPSGNNDDDEVTISAFSYKEALTCGWLVCVSGRKKGKDYRIVEGRNRIGTGMTMDIIIKDEDVIMDTHCQIVYDSRNTKFWLAPGEGSLTYYNDDLVTGKQELHTGDVIKIGSTRLMFIAFCEGERSWENDL